MLNALPMEQRKALEQCSRSIISYARNVLNLPYNKAFIEEYSIIGSWQTTLSIGVQNITAVTYAYNEVQHGYLDIVESKPGKEEYDALEVSNESDKQEEPRKRRKVD